MVSRGSKAALKTLLFLTMQRKFLNQILVCSMLLTATTTSLVLSMDLPIGYNVKWIILMSILILL